MLTILELKGNSFKPNPTIRYELTYEELEKQNKELLSHYNKLEEEKRVKTEHLKRLVAAKEKKVKELREQLMTQHLTAKLDRKSLQQEHSRMKQELQEQINELQAKLGKQGKTAHSF
ncbi:hypothetical protein GOODEAATRI_021398 [Goodea atripinnis]|uniref:Uncharacterized protein n=1 Tax=Goodea atripinnis TaxID=208336 RepID=A0ABV0PG49_9TELE